MTAESGDIDDGDGGGDVVVVVVVVVVVMMMTIIMMMDICISPSVFCTSSLESQHVLQLILSTS